MKHHIPVQDTDRKEVQPKPPTPAPRYFAHDIIDPIMQRLQNSPLVQLKFRKKGGPEDDEIKYIIFGPEAKGEAPTCDPFAKAVASECMHLTIDKDGHLTLASYIPFQQGLEPYAEFKTDPKVPESKDFSRLLNAFIDEVSRYYKSSFVKDNSKQSDAIRHMVLEDNPLRLPAKSNEANAAYHLIEALKEADVNSKINENSNGCVIRFENKEKNEICTLSIFKNGDLSISINDNEIEKQTIRSRMPDVLLELHIRLQPYKDVGKQIYDIPNRLWEGYSKDNKNSPARKRTLGELVP